MREVIQSLLATEAEAARLVASAKAEAEAIVSEAQGEVADVLAAGSREAEVKAAGILATAVQRSATERQDLVAAEAAAIQQSIAFSAECQERAIAQVIAAVCGQSESARE